MKLTASTSSLVAVAAVFFAAGSDAARSMLGGDMARLPPPLPAASGAPPARPVTSFVTASAGSFMVEHDKPFRVLGANNYWCELLRATPAHFSTLLTSECSVAHIAHARTASSPTG